MGHFKAKNHRRSFVLPPQSLSQHINTHMYTTSGAQPVAVQNKAAAAFPTIATNKIIAPHTEISIP